MKSRIGAGGEKQPTAAGLSFNRHMILNTIFAERPLRSESAPAVNHACRAASRSMSNPGEHAAPRRAELRLQGEVRAEVVARARVLATDPNYPPMAVLQKVAEQILATPELRETGI